MPRDGAMIFSDLIGKLDMLISYHPGTVFLHHQRPVAQSNADPGVLLDGGIECGAGDATAARLLAR